MARCISWVAIRHLAPLSTDEDLGTGVLLCGSGHGRLQPGLRAFHTLLGGGLLAVEWGAGGLNTLLGCRKCTFNLGAWGEGCLRGQESSDTKWLPHPCLLGGKRGQNCYITPAFSGVPNAKCGEKIKSGCLTPAFSGAQKRAELLRNPCILGGPQCQARGENQKWPTGGHIAYMHAFSVKLVVLFFAVRSCNFFSYTRLPQKRNYTA